MQKKRLQSQNDDQKTVRDKLFAEQRAIKESIKGPSNLQVRARLLLHRLCCWWLCASLPSRQTGFE